MSKRTTYILWLAGAVLVYELPYVLTLAKTGWEPLPPVLVADQMLYLNLSAIHHVSATEVLNPWYGTRVLAVDVPHLMFPIAFLLFRFMHAIAGSWTAAMLLWSAFWTALAFAAAVFCLESLLPDSDRTLTSAAAFGLLVLQSPMTYLGELRKLPALHGLFYLQLPYLRFAIPQVILPVVLTYWALQVRALRSQKRVALLGMALLQFALCAAFPYLLPVIAIGTGITFLIANFQREEAGITWRTALGFAALCGALDAGYLLLAGFAKSHANVHFAFHFRPEIIFAEVRPYIVVLIVASCLALLSRASLAARATVAGLALSNALFGFADVFLSPEAQMQQHPQYIIGITTWLPLFVFLWPYLERLWKSPVRILLVSALVLLAFREGYASSRLMLPMNVFQAAATRALIHLDLTGQDLIIPPSRFSDDISSWVPLISPAKVLYTPDGENVLSAADTRTEQTSRQAIYLMMTGMDAASLKLKTEPGSSDAQLSPLVQQGDRTHAGSPLLKDRVELRQVLRQRLLPWVSEFEADPSAPRKILGGYKRIIIIDSALQGLFDEGALSRWLRIEKDYDIDGVKVRIGSFKFGNTSEASHPDAAPFVRAAETSR